MSDYVAGRLVRIGAVLALAVAAWLPVEAAAEPAAMRIQDLSQPTRCAEDDNVYVALSGAGVRRFAIVSEHPRYMTPAMPDSTAPDFTDCDMTADPKFKYQPFEGVLWDDGRTKVVGYRFPSDWRPTQVPVTVGDRTVVGLHLIQMFHYLDGKPEEFLVTYPSDGYWRAKPLPPAGRKETAYGTSFLVGPLRTEGRPIAEIARLVIDPVARTYRIDYADGTVGRLAVAEISRTRAELRVELDRAVPAGQPFAGMRSMYVTASNADATRLGWLPGAGAAWRDQPLNPGVASAAEGIAVRLWRVGLSRHNTSAPETAIRVLD